VLRMRLPSLRSLAGRSFAVVLAAGVVLGGCGAPETAFEYRFLLRVEGDPGTPLAGAVVRRGAAIAGKSGPDGIVRLTAHGAEGSSLGFQVSCPEGHRSPALPVSILLRKLVQKDRYPEYRVSCPPLHRTLVVAVRAERGANLPVMHLGREVGRTDASGAAHVVVESAPEETVELTLDTNAQPLLRPRNPSARFRVKQADELVVYNQSFELERARVTGGGARRPVGPVRIR
jgi:hypothetical protein